MSHRRRMLRAIARKGTQATIYLDGTIGGRKLGLEADESASAVSFREQLAAAGDAETIRIEINCEGGVVTEGMSMYNALRACKAHKIGVVTGIAASMASVVLMACDEIRVAKGAYIMIHDPSGGARGRAKDLRKQADSLDQMREDLLDIYETRTGIERDKLEKYLDAETYFTAEEAVECGIADQIEDFEAKIDLQAVARLDRAKLPPALRKRIVAKAPLREGLRDLESALQGALREAYGTDKYPYVVDMFDDAVVFDLDGQLLQRSYTVKDGAVTLGDDETRVVRTYEKVPAALRALATKGKTMKGKNAKMKALEESKAKAEEELAKLKAMAAEGDDDEEEETDEDDDKDPEKDDDDDDDKDKPKDAATSALVAMVKTVTGTKDLGKATAKVAAMLSSAGAAAVGDRAKQVAALIKGGKLLPTLKSWALACDESAFREYVTSMGGSAVLKLGATHREPEKEPEIETAPQVRGGMSAEQIIGRQFKVDVAKIKKDPLPACVRAPGEVQ